MNRLANEGLSLTKVRLLTSKSCILKEINRKSCGKALIATHLLDLIYSNICDI